MSVDALNLTLSRADIERALSIARRPEAERARFHAPYVADVNDVTVEQIEAVTELRRCVLLAEERLRQGDWMFTQSARSAEDALRPWRGRLTIQARLRFHLQNTFVNVPPYEIVVGGPAGEAAPPPIESRTTPLSSFPFPTRGGQATSLIGAVIESQFAASSIGQTIRTVSVVLDGHTVARATFDLARLE